MPRTKTYSGRCHCGSVRFKFTSDEIKAGLRCNCSICIRKGAVMSAEYISPERFEALEGTEALSVYRFGDHDVNHYFCKRCGIYPFHDLTKQPGHYRVNLGCIDDIDTLALEVSVVDGRSF